MDGSRFDDLAKRLAVPRSRRATLRGLGRSMLVAVGIGGSARALLFAEHSSAAVCREGGAVCTEHSQCCSAECGDADRRGRRRCNCEVGTTVCGAHCCEIGETCVNGACRGEPVVCSSDCSVANGTGRCDGGTCVIKSCNPGFDNCDGQFSTGCETSLNTVITCGACNTVCPGYLQPNTNVTCQSGSCTFSCQGDHYDVDGDQTNGCEVSTTFSNHTQANAYELGSMSCNDSPGGSFTGTLPSDGRVHATPAVTGFSTITGSAPNWYHINATGGLCTNDIAATLQMTSSLYPTCYKLRVITDKGTYSAQTVSPSGIATISQGSGSYSDDTDIYIVVEKTCDATKRENVSYSVQFHL